MRSALAGLKPYRVDQNAAAVKLNQNESPCDIPARFKKKILEALAPKGVLIRTFDHPRLKNHARVTIGTPAENTFFLKTLRQAMKGR